MSEVFDPERVPRWKPLGDGIMLDTDPGNEDAPIGSEFILAADFLKLLALYREAVPLPVACCQCGHHPDGHCGPNGACTSRRQIDKAHPNQREHCSCKKLEVPATIDAVLNEMVRDFTKIGPRAKSEVRRRIREYAGYPKQPKSALISTQNFAVSPENGLHIGVKTP